MTNEMRSDNHHGWDLSPIRRPPPRPKTVQQFIEDIPLPQSEKRLLDVNGDRVFRVNNQIGECHDVPRIRDQEILRDYSGRIETLRENKLLPSQEDEEDEYIHFVAKKKQSKTFKTKLRKIASSFSNRFSRDYEKVQRLDD